ncbi:hypothetical protein Sjap_005157 [Stephania japonica]|uniref:Nuclear pore complex protein NUP98A-like n=1 Tax=Stephania japonica TaxID=461633 RepID=A0AAP0PJS8_9MAGN
MGVHGEAQSSAPMASALPTLAASAPAAPGSSLPHLIGASTTPTSGPSKFSYPFGETSQQTQPTSGNNLFGSSSFGSSSQPTVGATSTPAFGFISTPTTTIDASCTSAFGSSGGVFGGSATAFSFSTGSLNTPAFGAPSTPTFSASSTPAFVPSSTPSFTFSSSASFGQSTAALGSIPFRASSCTPRKSTSFGIFRTPAYGSTLSGWSGSRIVAYATVPNEDIGGDLQAISAMHYYEYKSHEELRWEDYRLGDKGGPNPPVPATVVCSGSPAAQFGQSSSNPFLGTFGTSLSPSPFDASTSPAFGSSSLPTSNVAGFHQTTPSLSAPIQSEQPFQTSGNFSQTQAVASSVFCGAPSSSGQVPFGQQSAGNSHIVIQAPMNPSGTLLITLKFI